jgi:hypothetical protein
MDLQKAVECERQRHAATAACLQQEQEMLAILGARLASMETVAGTSTTGVFQLKQQLQDEQHLHDIALRSLMQLRRAHALLQQQLAGMPAKNSNSSSSAHRVHAVSGAGMVFRVACLACGLAAAAVLRASTSPPALTGLAWPAMTAAVSAKATAAVLQGLCWLCRKAFVASTDRQHAGLQDQASLTASINVATSTAAAAAAAPASFNCWELGDVLIQAVDCSNSSSSIGDDSDLYYGACRSAGYLTQLPDSGSIGSEAEGICTWDGAESESAVQSCSSVDSTLFYEHTYSDDSSSTSSSKEISQCAESPHNVLSGPVPAKQEPDDTVPCTVLATGVLAEQQVMGAADSMQFGVEQRCPTYARGWVLETVQEKY